MKKSFITYIIFLIFSLILVSCGTSTGSRYEKARGKKEAVPGKEKPVTGKKDFDMAPYRAEIILPEPGEKDTLPKPDIWYTYTESAEEDTINIRTVIDKKDGYRVQVYSTDNLDEANTVRSELLFKTNQKNVYLIFEPPFYKVKVGDYLNISDANQMNFKLSQMGYTESRVVKDSVNVYQ
jgi:cell division protein FtsN